MRATTSQFRLWVGLTAALGASLIAGCCGGPFSADGESGCGACQEARAASASDDCTGRDASVEVDAALWDAGRMDAGPD